MCSSDGNCMYRSASLALYGSEHGHIYLRLITAIEILTNRSSYDTSARDHEHQKPNYHANLVVCPYDDLVSSVTTLGGGASWADMMHIYGLSAALDVVIGSYMPPTTDDWTVHSIYNCKIVGRAVRPTSTPKFTLMWSSVTAPRFPDEFRVNHFVFLAERPNREPQCITIDSDESEAASVLSAPSSPGSDADDDAVKLTDDECSKTM